MKLLFDENLPPALARILAAEFPGSIHVRDAGLKGHPDDAVWGHARVGGFIIVSKDSDFYDRALLFGHPPKFIWLQSGNCTRNDLVNLIRAHLADIAAFATDPFESVLILV